MNVTLGVIPRLTATHSTFIRPSRGWNLLDFREIWAYRELFYFLTWRDIKVRYKQTVLGAVWALLQPLMLAVIFFVVFRRLAGVSSHGQPYLLFAYSALVPWVFFSQSVTSASESLLVNANLVSKIYFPRVIAPIAAAGAHVMDMLISLGLVAIMMAYFGVVPRAALLWLPALILFALLAALSVGLWLAALNVRFRDVRYAVPFFLNALIFLSPLGYSSTEFEGALRLAYGLNPISGVAESFRWVFLGTALPTRVVVTSLLTSVLLFATGLAYFRRVEKTFADII